MFKKIAVFFLGILIAGCNTLGNKTGISVSGGSNDKSHEFNIYSEEENAFKVAMLLPLSGASSAYGIGLKNAAMMALEDTNNKNLVLQFFDTQSTPQGAVSALNQAVDNEAKLILGPLMSQEVEAISSTALNNKVPVISFSTSPSVLREGIYTLGLLGDEQINRIISYAANKQRTKIIVMVPDTTAGLNMAKSAVLNAPKYGAKIVKIGFYPADTIDFAPIVKSLTDYDTRSAEITKRKQKLQALADKGDKNALAELKQIKNVYTTGEVDFDAVLIAETGSRLKSAAVMFGYYDIYYPEIMFLGTSVWENTSLNKETTLYHGVYPAISRVHNSYFNKKYANYFGQIPNQLYSFAYDGVALASALALKNPDMIYENITDSDGYIGINGAFRIFDNGTNEHSLDILEVTEKGPQIIDKAPSKFELKNNVDVIYDSFVTDFPIIFGKDEQEVKNYILAPAREKTHNFFF